MSSRNEWTSIVVVGVFDTRIVDLVLEDRGDPTTYPVNSLPISLIFQWGFGSRSMNEFYVWRLTIEMDVAERVLRDAPVSVMIARQADE